MTLNPSEQDPSEPSGAGAQRAPSPTASRLRRVGRVIAWPIRALFLLLRRFWLLLLLLAGIAAFVFYIVLPRVLARMTHSGARLVDGQLRVRFSARATAAAAPPRQDA